MKIESLIEIISAMHLSHYIANNPFPERGGLMFVAPPGSFKTAITQTLENYSNAIVISDLTVKQAARLREDVSSERIITLAFTDLEKLYQRQGSTASNIEGVIKAFAAEGFRRANWEDQRMQVVPARCCIIAGMTVSCYDGHFSQWLDDGFARRFLWSRFLLDEPGQILEAIVQWQRIELSTEFSNKIPTTKSIPYIVDEKESRHLLTMLNFQPGKEIGLASMKKMLCALKWKFPHSQFPMQILEDFASSLGKHGSRLVLDGKRSHSSSSRSARRRTIQQRKSHHTNSVRQNDTTVQPVQQGQNELSELPITDVSSADSTTDKH